MAIVEWRGVRLDERTASMMNAAAGLTDVRITPIQGSYSTSVGASSGTHAGGGAIDVGCRGLTVSQMREIETAMRRVGFAAWLRFPNDLWDYHVHGIAIGCDDLAPLARTQVTNYMDGTSGLKGGGKDTGTRAYVGVTWESYLGGGGATGPTGPGSSSGVGSSSSWLTGAGTIVAAPAQTITGLTEEIEARFSPAHKAA